MSVTFLKGRRALTMKERAWVSGLSRHQSLFTPTLKSTGQNMSGLGPPWLCKAVQKVWGQLQFKPFVKMLSFPSIVAWLQMVWAFQKLKVAVLLSIIRKHNLATKWHTISIIMNSVSLCASSKPGQISEDAFIVIPTSVIHTMPWLVCFRFQEPLVSGAILDWVDTSPGLR